MTDQELIKQWDEYVESMGSVMGEVEHMAQQMADRIEELEKRNKELTLQLLATSGQAADALDKLAKAEKDRNGYLAERNKFQLYLQRTYADCELEVAAVDALNAKLAKAVEALRKIADYTHIGEGGQGVTQHAEARIARAVLADLEGK